MANRHAHIKNKSGKVTTHDDIWRYTVNQTLKIDCRSIYSVEEQVNINNAVHNSKEVGYTVNLMEPKPHPQDYLLIIIVPIVICVIPGEK